MTTFIENNLSQKLSPSKINEQSLIYQLLPAALATVPFHKNTAALKRYVATDFPFHLAVHVITGVITPPAEYTEPHVHHDDDEINIILSEKILKYRIQLGEENFIVVSNSSIWIPKGMIHSANVLEGSGYFITIRI